MAAEGGFGPDLRGDDGGADLLASVRRPRPRQGDTAVQEEPGGHRARRAGCEGPAVRPDRRVRPAVDAPICRGHIPGWHRGSRTTSNLPGSPNGPRRGIAMSEVASRETARERANREQLAASDPAISAFVAASAGSGKTKLLTDRLLRLMLTGAPPERIQCLTFTKAAAAEMALRLQRTLGRWVTMPPRTGRRTAAGCEWSRPRRPASTARALVRQGARPARRHADRHDPRLQPVAAAPLPAGGRDLAAFPVGR